MTHQMRLDTRAVWPPIEAMLSPRPADDLRGSFAEPQEPVATFLLDAMSVCAVLVDGNAVVRMMSTKGAELLRRPGSGMVIHSAGPEHAGAMRLVALHREDSKALRLLVASAACGGPGGSLRIRAGAADDRHESIQVAVVVPLQSGRASGGGLALVRIEDLGERLAPSSGLLCSIFGFTPCEADVALRLVGGASAEEVAARRAVSLDTVRHQIRSILRKSEANNLRDFERLMATLAKFGADGVSRAAALERS
jgi:DNA-binding CsgD family transcriptional regulator